MATPWQAHTRKQIDGITHQPRVRAAHAFVPPPARTRLRFSQAELCASMAMTNALSGMSIAAAGSLAQAMSQLVTDHVDDDPAIPLQFLDSVPSWPTTPVLFSPPAWAPASPISTHSRSGTGSAQ